MESSKEKMLEEIRAFELPGYKEIPNVGLFLEQTSKYIEEYMKPLDNIALTGSMISNYVKSHLIRNPVKKQYDREQIAYLFFIAAAKSVLSLEDIRLMLELQKTVCTAEEAYEYFRSEFKAVLLYVFRISKDLPEPSGDHAEARSLMRSTAITICHKIYLAECFRLMREEVLQASDSAL